MRIAIIDLGTNTFNLIIEEIEKGHLKHLFEAKCAVKLGEGGINKNIILQEPINRAISTLTSFNETIKKWTGTIPAGYRFSHFIVRTPGRSLNTPDITEVIKEANVTRNGLVLEIVALYKNPSYYFPEPRQNLQVPVVYFNGYTGDVYLNGKIGTGGGQYKHLIMESLMLHKHG